MKIILGVVIGAVVGFTVGYLGRCASGVCLLTSNPVISTLVGALIGFIIVLGK